MIAHLRGREEALEPLGWTGRQAEWIALVCLHSGVFTRTQLSAHLGLDRWKALRFVLAMSDQRLADEEMLGGLRPPERRCRSRGCGRGGSDPPLSMPGTASGRVGCARPSTLRREVAPVQQSRAGRPSVTWDGRVPDLAAWAVARAIGGTPALLGDARLPDGRPVGERVIRRLEAALKPPSRVGIDGSGATPRDGGRGVKTHLRPNPYQALGRGGRSRHGPSRRCATGDRAADPQDDDAPADRRKVGCASPEARSAHRHPASFARSSTAVSGSAGASANGLRPASPPTEGSGLGTRRPSTYTPSAPTGFRRTRPSRPPMWPSPTTRTSPSRTVRPVSSAAASRASAGLAPDPLLAGSQPTLWGHASRVPGRGWRGVIRPLRSPGGPHSGGVRARRARPFLCPGGAT